MTDCLATCPFLPAFWQFRQAGVRKDEEQYKTRQQAGAIMPELKILWPAALHPL